MQAYSFRICVELDHVLSLTKKDVTPRLLKGMLISSHDFAPTLIQLSCDNLVPFTLFTDQFGDTLLLTPNSTKEEEDRVLSAKEVEEVVVDEIGGVLWRLVYLKNENLNTPHIMEFAK